MAGVKASKPPGRAKGSGAKPEGVDAVKRAARPKGPARAGTKAAKSPAKRRTASRTAAKRAAVKETSTPRASAAEPAAAGVPPSRGNPAQAWAAGASGGLAGLGDEMMQSFTKLLPAAGPGIKIPPERLASLQQEYAERWQALLGSAAGHAAPGLRDRRFAHQTWHDNGPFTWTAALYLLNSEFMQKLADSMEGERQLRDRVRFATQQWVDMLSPTNFLATNPEAQLKLLETKGESLRAGLENLFDDLQKGRITQTDEEAFEVGRNVATSPGAVVYQNELIQLIQYAPSTPQVGSRPLLMVPPSINKFYIMDLQPDGSLVAHAVSQGHTVYMVSWRNVGVEHGHLTWDDYLEMGVFDAIRVVREISGSETINALGFCVGGTILATALAALAARGERPVRSLTLMTTLVDFSEPGMLGVFVDENSIQMREQSIGSGGLLHGKDLSTTFSSLRPNDLVWNYYVNNYLKGERPPAFDLLYWNSDSTNLPGPMYCWYLRHMYLQNELRIPNRLVCAGQPIDLGRINLPTFVFGAREDHIVLWKGAYAGAKLLKGPVRFVLGASGHIAGAINPAKKNKRSYWTDGPPDVEPDEWFDRAKEHPGSWWNDWSAWLEPHRGELKAAPKEPGSRKHRPIEDAPGSYVKAHATE